MIIEVRLLDDLGNDLIPPQRSENPERPLQWKVPPDKPIIIPRGAKTQGRYKYYGFTYAPIVTLDLRES